MAAACRLPAASYSVLWCLCFDVPVCACGYVHHAQWGHAPLLSCRCCVQVLRRAFECIMDRHEVFRQCFFEDGGVPRIKVLPPGSLRVPFKNVQVRLTVRRPCCACAFVLQSRSLQHGAYNRCNCSNGVHHAPLMPHTTSASLGNSLITDGMSCKLGVCMCRWPASLTRCCSPGGQRT